MSRRVLPGMTKVQPLPRVLLTGFDAFGTTRQADIALNSSWLAAQALHGKQIAGHRVVAAQLPTAFNTSVAELTRLLQLHQPALVICLGQAGGRQALSLERIAINLDDAPMVDNAGEQPIDAAVVEGGPAAYFSTLPIKAMLVALHRDGIAAELSQSAGTFVCNHVFYALMHLLASPADKARARGGFVHVPYLPGQGKPCMPLEEMVAGLRTMVACALLTRDDCLASAGALS